MCFWMETFLIIIAASIFNPSCGEYYMLSFKLLFAFFNTQQIDNTNFEEEESFIAVMKLFQVALIS